MTLWNNPAPITIATPGPIELPVVELAETSVQSAQPVLSEILAKPIPDLKEIKCAARLLFGNAPVELRAFSGGTWSGYYDDLNTLAQDVFDLSRQESFEAVYWTLQTLSKDLQKLVTNSCSKVTKTTNDDGVASYYWLFFDCDPRRPTGVSSTDAEKKFAYALALRVKKFLNDRGFDVVLCDSGNGYHLLVRINLARGEAGLVQDLLKAVSLLYSTPEVEVDVKVFNPARICKAYGSAVRKGEHSQERPWRLSRIIDAPDTLRVATKEGLENLLSHLQKEMAEKGVKPEPEIPVTAALDGPKIPNGNHDVELTRIAGHLRTVEHLEPAELNKRLIEICENRCLNYGNDYQEMTLKIANSIGGKPIKNTDVLINGKLAGSVSVSTSTSMPMPAGAQPLDESMIDRSEVAAKPEFPRWVFHGTSIYSGLVEPACALSTKIPEFIWMPAAVTIMNYLSGKVRVKDINEPLSINLGGIACKGGFKNSSAQLAFDYCDVMGIRSDNHGANSEGKSISFSVGSMEGLGVEMARANCKSAVLYNDEFRDVASKMGIENSSCAGKLLTVYEAGKFENTVKKGKESFSFPANSYCVSWIFYTTYKDFNKSWTRVMGTNTDLIDRMFFLLGPEKTVKVKSYTNPNTLDGSVVTRQLIDKALTKGFYEYEDPDHAARQLDKAVERETREEDEDALDLSGSRMMGIIRRFAFFFAVDMDKPSIDADCIERGIALLQYRNAAIRYLRPIESGTYLGQLQQSMLHALRSSKGQMSVRDWKRKLNYRQYDTETWGRAEGGLVKTGQIRMDAVKKSLSGRPTALVTLLMQRE